MRVPLQITSPSGARGGALCVAALSAFIGPNCAAVTGTRKKKGAPTGTELLGLPPKTFRPVHKHPGAGHNSRTKHTTVKSPLYCLGVFNQSNNAQRAIVINQATDKHNDNGLFCCHKNQTNEKNINFSFSHIDWRCCYIQLQQRQNHPAKQFP